MKSFYSNGKLLLTSEYFVLGGALALAIPTCYGQNLCVTETADKLLTWESFDEKEECWFSATFEIPNLRILSSTYFSEKENDSDVVAERLLQILTAAQKINSDFLSTASGYHVKTNLDFPRNWGLGTSSTLINNLAQWAQLNPFHLLKKTFGGSGYDIACAQQQEPLFFNLENGLPKIKSTSFYPSFYKNIFFIYLNKKKNSRKGIQLYNEHKIAAQSVLSEINVLTKKISTCNQIDEFKELINQHENIVSKVFKLPKVKDSFPDFNGALKSLGAWGGDFILAVGDENTPDYFFNKGFKTIIPFEKMVYSQSE